MRLELVIGVHFFWAKIWNFYRLTTLILDILYVQKYCTPCYSGSNVIHWRRLPDWSHLRTETLRAGSGSRVSHFHTSNNALGPIPISTGYFYSFKADKIEAYVNMRSSLWHQYRRDSKRAGSNSEIRSRLWSGQFSSLSLHNCLKWSLSWSRYPLKKTSSSSSIIASDTFTKCSLILRLGFGHDGRDRSAVVGHPIGCLFK